MLISDRKNFIFVHIYKTGGSSVTKLLGPYVDERYRSQTTRTEGVGWQGTWHYEQRQHAKLALLRGHPAWREKDLSGYRICTVVRNPYTWAVSVWNNFYRHPEYAPNWFSYLFPDRTFADFCRAMKAAHMGLNRHVFGGSCQSSFISDPELKPAFVARFERLEDDVREMLSLLGIPASRLPHTTRDNAVDRLEPMSFYDSDSLAIVNSLFADDFRAFGYPMA